MATTSRTRRKAPAPATDRPAADPVPAVATAVAEAPAAPADAAPASAAPPPPRQAAARKTAAKKAAAKTAAGKTAAGKKAAAKKTPARQRTPGAAPSGAAGAPPQPGPVAPEAAAEADATSAPAAAPAAPPAPEPAPEPTPALAPAAAATPASHVAPGAAPPAARQRTRGRRRPAADPQAAATAQAVLALLADGSGAAAGAPNLARAGDDIGTDTDTDADTSDHTSDDTREDDAPAGLPAASQAAAKDHADDADGGDDTGADPGDEAATGNAPPAPAPAPAPMRQPRPEPEPAPAPEPVAQAPLARSGQPHSIITLQAGDAAQIVFLAGDDCPPALRQAARRRSTAQGVLPPEDDAALPQLLRVAQEAGHRLQVDEAVWPHLAAHRDARRRLSVLEAAYPDGPASAALQQLLRAPLPLYQAEGALFAVVAGRALIADERGLGKTVQAMAAAQLWRRHFGVQRVLVLCAPAQRAGWQRAWQRFAGAGAADGGAEAQVVDGGHHQRQAQWSAAAGVRIIAPQALQTDAAHLAHWAPDLVIIDEPQQLALHAADWAALDSVPQALVLSGAPLADLPELTDTLLQWLDHQRLGPLAALRELQAAARDGRALDEADIERLTGALSRLMLQRLRDDVAAQLPPVVHSERLVPLAPGQRAAHDAQLASARRLLAGWLASGWCSDSDQWRLAQALRAMQHACHRADPADAHSPLAEATVQALAAALADLAGTGAPRTAVLCDSAADVAQLAARLATPAGGDASAAPLLLGPGDALPGGVQVVLQAGVPWRPRRHAAGPRGETTPGQQWLYLVAQHSIDCGLFSTLAGRTDVPRGPAEGGARGWLQGEALLQWLGAVQAALQATPMAAD